MKTINPIAVLASLLALAGWAGTAVAQNNNQVRFGAYFVMYDVKAQDVSGPFVPSGVNLDVKDVQTPYFAYVRRLSPTLELELAAGLPPKTETVGKGPATLGSVPYNGQTIATAKWFSPTLLLNYKFFEESSKWRPYVGVGINYTHFFDRTSTAAGDAANGGPTRISLSNSIGPAATVGVSYRLQDHWNLYASYSISRIKSDLQSDTSGIVRKTTINFNPSAVVLSAGYSF